MHNIRSTWLSFGLARDPLGGRGRGAHATPTRGRVTSYISCWSGHGTQPKLRHTFSDDPIRKLVVYVVQYGVKLQACAMDNAQNHCNKGRGVLYRMAMLDGLTGRG